MAQFNTGNTWSSGNTVTATKLNQMITDATIRVDAITDQSEASSASNTDMVLIESGGSLYKVAAEYIGALGVNSASTDEILVGDGSGGTNSYSAFTLDSTASPTNGDILTYDSSDGHWTSSAGATGNTADTDEVLVGDGSGGISSGGSNWVIDSSVSPSDGDKLSWDNSNGYWTASSSAVDGAAIAMGSDAQGDILYYDGTSYVRLGAGTAGQVLQSGGADANPSWVDQASNPSVGEIDFYTYTGVSGTFEVPPSITRIKLTAGGGGGGGNNNNDNGGAGGYFEKTITVTPETDVTFTVGGGGAGQDASSGSSGGSTTVTYDGTTYTAGGGSGGGSGGGGTATGGTINITGGASSIYRGYGGGGSGGDESTGSNGQGGFLKIEY